MINVPTNCFCCTSSESLSSFKTINGSWPVSAIQIFSYNSPNILVVFKGTGSMLSMLLPWVLFWKESVADLKIFISRLRDTPAWIFSTVLYNLVFLFNVGHGFFLCNVEEIFAMLAARLQQSVIIKKKNHLSNSDVVQTKIHCVFSCAMLSEVFWAILHIIYLCNVVSRVLRQHWTGFFHVQYCLELLG